MKMKKKKKEIVKQNKTKLNRVAKDLKLNSNQLKMQKLND